MTSIQIRVAATADLPAVAAFRWAEDAIDSDGVSQFVAEFVEWAAAHPDHHVIAAFDGDRVVGMAWLAVLPRVPGVRAFDRAGGDVQTVFVLPEYRNRGIGGAIMRRVIELAEELKLGRVTVQSTTRAIPMYERAGFLGTPNLLARDPGPGDLDRR